MGGQIATPQHALLPDQFGKLPARLDRSLGIIVGRLPRCAARDEILRALRQEVAPENENRLVCGISLCLRSTDVAHVKGRKQIRARHGELVGVTEWIANDLDPGDYMVTVGGPKPLQRVGRAVTIKAAQVTQLEVKIEPIDLVGTVSRGNTRVPHAEITLKSHQGGWESLVTTNEEGTFEEELWQGGRVLAAVSVGGASAPYIFLDEIHDDPSVRWDIKIPSGTVSGRVFDARSGKPIAGASITLDSKLPDDSNKSLGTTADESGHFAFDGVGAGAQSVYAEASRYLTSAPQSFVFSQDDERKDLEVALMPAARYPLSRPPRDAAERPRLSVVPGGRPPAPPV